MTLEETIKEFTERGVNWLRDPYNSDHNPPYTLLLLFFKEVMYHPDFNRKDLEDMYQTTVDVGMVIALVLAMKRMVYKNSVAEYNSRVLYTRQKEKMKRQVDIDAILDIAGYGLLHLMIYLKLDVFPEGFLDEKQPIEDFSDEELQKELAKRGIFQSEKGNWIYSKGGLSEE